MVLHSLIQHLKNRTMSSRILLIPQDQMARLIQTVEENLESAEKKKKKKSGRRGNNSIQLSGDNLC